MSLKFMPTRLTMEGMIQKADRVLDHVAKTDDSGAIKGLFQKAKGIILISVVEGAVCVSAAAGVGIMLIKDPDDTWSPPCACGMAATSWGFSLGAIIKDVIVFAMDEKSVRAFTSKVGLTLGVGTSVTLGKVGTNVAADVSLSTSGTSGTVNVHNSGVGGTVSIAFCQGAYVSASISGAVVGPRDMVNRDFYEEKTITAEDILFGDIDIPREKFSPVLGDVYDKLDDLSYSSFSSAMVPKDLGLFLNYSNRVLTGTNYLSAVSTVVLQSVTEEVIKGKEEEKDEKPPVANFCSSPEDNTDRKERRPSVPPSQISLRTSP